METICEGRFRDLLIPTVEYIDRCLSDPVRAPLRHHTAFHARYGNVRFEQTLLGAVLNPDR